jgi:hypothetical protein
LQLSRRTDHVETWSPPYVSTYCSPVRVGLLLIAFVSLAAVAHGADEPTAFGSAKAGSLAVTSGVFVEAKGVGLRGVWLDQSLPCTAKRSLRIHAVVDFVPPTEQARAAGRTRTFSDANCAEGGPNVGFQLSARKLGFACPDGTWKPARYNFLTRTTETRRKVTALASLIWIKRGRC